MKMKHCLVMFLALLMLLALPMASFGEEPFVFRGRYNWEMTEQEVKALAEEEGLVDSISVTGSFCSYEDVPVAAITAELLIFTFQKDGLDEIQYALTTDPQEAQVLYPLLQEQLTLVYGEPSFADSEAAESTWELSDTLIVLRANNPRGFSDLIYTRIKPEPTPSPTPVAPSLSTDGL